MFKQSVQDSTFKTTITCWRWNTRSHEPKLRRRTNSNKVAEQCIDFIDKVLWRTRMFFIRVIWQFLTVCAIQRGKWSFYKKAEDEDIRERYYTSTLAIEF